MILVVIITVAATLVVSTFVSMLLSESDLSIPSVGTIKASGVEAYWDRNLTNRTMNINWGTISPGSSANVTLYLKSVSVKDVNLSLAPDNWNPGNLSVFMSLAWSYNGTAVRPGQVIQVTIVLSASYSNAFIRYIMSNDIKQFSFDVLIDAHE